MIDPENNLLRPEPVPVSELPSLDEGGILLHPTEKLILQLGSEYDSLNMKSYTDPSLNFGVAGKPVAVIRAGGLEPGEYQDYVVLDMRYLPVVGSDNFRYREDGSLGLHIKRQLPNGQHTLGDIAVVRPLKHGEHHEITPLENGDSSSFGKQTLRGQAVGLGNKNLDKDIPSDVSDVHFKVYYDHQDEQVIINNNNPTNQTVIYNGENAPGNPVAWDESVNERAVEQQMARLLLESLTLPDDLRND